MSEKTKKEPITYSRYGDIFNTKFNNWTMEKLDLKLEDTEG